VRDAVVYHRQTIKSSLNARRVEIKIESKAKERRIRVVGTPGGYIYTKGPWP
jgi:hypothetical protein